jgi:hypothetical protein
MKPIVGKPKKVGFFREVWNDFLQIPADEEQLKAAEDCRFPSLSAPRQDASAVLFQQKVRSIAARTGFGAMGVGLLVHAAEGPTSLDLGLFALSSASLLLAGYAQKKVGLTQTALAGLTRSPLTYAQQKGLSNVPAAQLALQAGQVTKDELKDAVNAVLVTRDNQALAQAREASAKRSSPKAPKP